MKLLHFISLSSIFFITISNSFAGGWTSGGGKNIYSDFDNPWFLGDNPIEYCIQQSSDFPLSTQVVRELITESFEEWKAIFIKYGLYKSNLPGEFFDHKKRSITLDSIEVSKCTNPAQQIIFKVGVVDNTMIDYFKSNTKQVVGLAIRKTYNHKSFKNGGIIWIAPKNWIGEYSANGVELKEFPIWNTKEQVKSILLHELAHIFGVPHIPSNKVLSEAIMQYLAIDQQYSNAPGPNRIIPLIETESVRLNPFKDPTHITLTNKFNSSNDPQNILLNSSGHNSKTDPWKTAKLQFTSSTFGHQLKFDITTKNGKVYTYNVKFDGIGHNSFLYTKDRTLTFVSPNYKIDGSYAYETLFPLYPSQHMFIGKIKAGKQEFVLSVEFSDFISLNLIKSAGNWNNSYWK